MHNEPLVSSNQSIWTAVTTLAGSVGDASDMCKAVYLCLFMTTPWHESGFPIIGRVIGHKKHGLNVLLKFS